MINVDLSTKNKYWAAHKTIVLPLVLAIKAVQSKIYMLLNKNSP